MSKKERTPDYDDGRTIADMSGVGRSTFRLPRRHWDPGPDSEAGERQTYKPDRSERRAILGGALTAGLLVVLVLAIGFAALILLIQLLWS